MTRPRFPYTLTEEELAAPTMGEALCGWLDRKIAHERHQAGADDVVVDVDAPEPPPLPEGVRSDSDPETPASQPMCGTDLATLCIPK